MKTFQNNIQERLNGSPAINKNQLDFAQAKAKHLLFKARIRAIVYGIDVEEAAVTSHHECSVGKWIYSHALEAYSHLPEIFELEKEHEYIHTISRELIQLYNSGNVEEARKGLERIEEASDKMIALLNELEKKTGSVKPSEEYLVLEENLSVYKDLQKINHELENKIKEQTAELQKEKDRFETAFKNASVGIVMVTMQGRFMHVNPTFLKMTGYTEKELSSRDFISITHPDDVQSNILFAKQLINRETEGFEVEKRYIKKDGSICWVHNSISIIRNPAGEPLYGITISQDITERKRAEEKLLAMNVELSNKNEELHRINVDLDNFIYTASHDLKSPMSNIEGLINALSEIIKEDDFKREELLPIVDMINASIGRFSKTIKDLTTITKIQKDFGEEREKIVIAELIEDIKASIHDLIASAGATITTNFEACGEINFSRKNLKSIMYNLISNAIKYRSPTRLPVVEVKTERIPGYIVLTVTDNGLGLDKEKQKKMFTMFKRFHDHVEGTGIGLYIVKRIMDNAGGRIELQSEPDKGTTFRVYFLAGV